MSPLQYFSQRKMRFVSGYSCRLSAAIFNRTCNKNVMPFYSRYHGNGVARQFAHSILRVWLYHSSLPSWPGSPLQAFGVGFAMRVLTSYHIKTCAGYVPLGSLGWYSCAHIEWQTRRAQPEVSGQLVFVKPLHYTLLLNLNMPNHHHYEECTPWISLNVNLEALGKGLKQNPKNLARGDTRLFRSRSWWWSPCGKLVWVLAGDTCRWSCRMYFCILGRQIEPPYLLSINRIVLGQSV